MQPDITRYAYRGPTGHIGAPGTRGLTAAACTAAHRSGNLVPYDVPCLGAWQERPEPRGG